MPTPTQIQELLDNATTAWTTSDSVSGMTFTSKKDTSKSIFIPAAGDAYDGIVYTDEFCGYIWSSMLYKDDIFNGQCIEFSSLGSVYYASLLATHRCFGLSVRGVLG